MPSKWNKVFSTTFAHQASIVKEFLEDKEIPAVVMDKQDSAYKFGGFEVYVPPEFTILAIRLVDEQIKFK